MPPTWSLGQNTPTSKWQAGAGGFQCTAPRSPGARRPKRSWAGATIARAPATTSSSSAASPIWPGGAPLAPGPAGTTSRASGGATTCHSCELANTGFGARATMCASGWLRMAATQSDKPTWRTGAAGPGAIGSSALTPAWNRFAKPCGTPQGTRPARPRIMWLPSTARPCWSSRPKANQIPRVAAAARPGANSLIRRSPWAPHGSRTCEFPRPAPPGRRIPGITPTR